MKIKTEVEVSILRIGYLLCSAFESGYSDWCLLSEENSVRPSKIDLEPFKDDSMWSKQEYFYIHWPLLEGGRLCVYDRYEIDADGHDEVNKLTKHFIDLESIEKGLTLMAVKYPIHFNNFVVENDDAITADIFLQCCVLGEVKYG